LLQVAINVSLMRYMESSRCWNQGRLYNLYSKLETMGEQQYLDLVQKILDLGDSRDDRTSTGTLSLCRERMRFNLGRQIGWSF